MINLTEQLNQLLRTGEGSTFLIASPRIDSLIQNGRLLQESSRVPMTDALRIAVKTAELLLKGVQHLKEEYGVAVDKAAFEALLISAVKVKWNGDLDLEPLDAHEDVDEYTFAKCHEAALAISKQRSDLPSMDMETFEELLRTSPSPQVTRDLLAQLGPAERPLTGPTGALPKLPARFPETLHARQKVDLTVRVLNVREDENEARVQIVSKNDVHSQTVLDQHVSEEMTLRFDGKNAKSRHRADLTAAQYLQLKLRISAIADCATHRRFQAKGALNLLKVLEPRDPIDQLHAAAEQVQLQLGFGNGPASPSGPETK